MSRAPSDRVLNKTVTIVRGSACDDEPASGDDATYRANIDAMDEQSQVAAGVEVIQNRSKVIMRDNLGNARYVKLDVDMMDFGGHWRLFVGSGRDQE
jgi:hypothetical protein